MSPKSQNEEDNLISKLQRDKEVRSQTYRERALKMYPWICARCGREFSGKKLRELTVHHKDHNHDNNLADGSNWELLCLYCHDYEHTKHPVQTTPGETSTGSLKKPSSTHQPFADLDKWLKNKQ